MCPQKRDLRDVVADAKARNSEKEDHTDEDYAMFLDMVHKMVTYEPAERIKPHEALIHPFLNGKLPRPPIMHSCRSISPCSPLPQGIVRGTRQQQRRPRAGVLRRRQCNAQP